MTTLDLNSTNTDSNAFPSLSPAGRIAKGSIHAVFCCIVLFAIAHIVNNKTMSLPSKVLLINLMVSHFSYWWLGLIRIFSVQYFTGMYCIILVYMSTVQLYGTIFAIAAVTADRFISTRFPFMYMDLTYGNMFGLVALMWMVTPAFAYGTFYGVEETNACDPWSSIPTLGLCLFGITVAISTFAVMVMCFYVLKEVLRHNRSIHSTTVSWNRSERHSSRLIVKQLDTTFTFAMIALSNCMMTFPLVIIFPLMNSEGINQNTLLIVSAVLATCSRVTDPFVYILRNKLKNRICCKPRSTTILSFSSGSTDNNPRHPPVVKNSIAVIELSK